MANPVPLISEAQAAAPLAAAAVVSNAANAAAPAQRRPLAWLGGLLKALPRAVSSSPAEAAESLKRFDGSAAAGKASEPSPAVVFNASSSPSTSLAAPSVRAQAPKTPLVPPAPEVGAPKKGLPAALVAVLGAVFVSQFGIEAMGLAAPQVAGEMPHGKQAASALAMSSMLALSLGNSLAGPIVKRLRPLTALCATFVARAAAIGTMTFLLRDGLAHPGNLALNPAGNLAILVGLFSLDYVLLGISRAIEAGLGAIMLGNDVVQNSRYGSSRQLIIDAVGVVGPLVAAAALAHGYPAVFAAYPLLFLASAAVSLWGVLKRRKQSRPDQVAASSSAQTETLTTMDALRAIWRNPVLRNAALAFSIFNAVAIPVYFLIAPAFGFFAALSSASQVTGLMFSSFAAGGLLGSIAMKLIGRSIDREVQAVPEGASREAASARSMLRWMASIVPATGASYLLVWSFLVRVPLLTAESAPFWLGKIIEWLGSSVYPAHLAMFAIGFGLVLSMIGLDSIILTSSPDNGKIKTAGIIRTLANLSAFASSLALGQLFQHYSVGKALTSGAMTFLGIGLTALGIVAALTGRAYRRASREAKK